MKVLNCAYCNSSAHHEWGDGAGESYRVECSAASDCKQWPRIYAETKTHAIAIWNSAMGCISAINGKVPLTGWRMDNANDSEFNKRV